MRALVYDGTTPQLIDRPEPAKDAETAAVRVTLAGICNTDLEIVRGYMQFLGTLGHEFVGIVEHGSPEWCGRRVVGEINFGCGTCLSCRQGMARHCRQRRVMGILRADGAFADLVAVPIANLHRVPESVADEEAVFAEPLAAAFEILEQVRVEPRTSCTVLGDGKLGLLIAQVLALAEARVLLVGHHDAHLEIVRRRGIAGVAAESWDRAPTDLVVEATGTAAGFETAVAATRPRGTLVLKTTAAKSQALNLAPLVINEITVVGSRCGRFAPALDALAAGTVDVRSLIAATRSLDDAPDALRQAAAPGTLKVLLAP